MTNDPDEPLRGFEKLGHFHSVCIADELLPYTNTGIEGHAKIDVQRDTYVIFMQAMQNGLLRIKLQGPANRLVILRVVD